ncbi:hypothetical protein ACWDE9_37210 [Streptomyces olivaceoviridis]
MERRDRTDHREDRMAPPDDTDRFERELTRLMRRAEQPVPFEVRHREALRAGVCARRRVRAARRAAGSVLAVAGLGLGLFLGPHGHTADRPTAPRPRPALSPAPTPSTSPSQPPSGTPGPPPSTTTSTPTDLPSPGSTTTTSAPPAAPEGSTTATYPPPTATAISGEDSTTPPATATASGPAGPSDDPSPSVGPSD